MLPENIMRSPQVGYTYYKQSSRFVVLLAVDILLNWPYAQWALSEKTASSLAPEYCQQCRVPRTFSSYLIHCVLCQMSADRIVLSKFRLNLKLYINFISARKEVLDIFFPFTYTAAIKLVPLLRAAFKMKRWALSVLSYYMYSERIWDASPCMNSFNCNSRAKILNFYKNFSVKSHSPHLPNNIKCFGTVIKINDTWRITLIYFIYLGIISFSVFG